MACKNSCVCNLINFELITIGWTEFCFELMFLQTINDLTNENTKPQQFDENWKIDENIGHAKSGEAANISTSSPSLMS